VYYPPSLQTVIAASISQHPTSHSPASEEEALPEADSTQMSGHLS